MLYRFADCALDSQQHQLRRGKQLLDVEPRMFAVLLYLLERPGELVTRDELFDQCWPGMYVSDGTLTRARQPAASSHRP